MRFEDAMTAHYEGKSSPIDPGILDPDFDICIRARAAMSQPCFWMQSNFGFEAGIPLPQACWMGHILRIAFGPLWFCEVVGNTYHQLENRIARKLGFNHAGDIYSFNDTNSHEDV